MKKYFKNYFVAWLVVFVVFQVVAFCIPAPAGKEKFTGSFWAGYIAATLVFLGQLGCAWYAFSQSDTKEKTFLNMPLITVSRTCVILTVIVSLAGIFVPGFKLWMEIVLLALILGFYALTVVSSLSSAQVAEETEQRVKEKTFFIRSLTVDAEVLYKGAPDDQKETMKKVYEAVRYSDPCSSERLAGDEAKISDKFTELSEQSAAGDKDAVEKTAKELIVLLEARNKKCMLLK